MHVRLSAASLLIVVLIATQLRAQIQGGEVATLVATGRETCAIVSDSSDGLGAQSATKLADYLFLQTGTKPTILRQQDLNAANARHTLVVIDGTPEQRLLSTVGVKVDVPGDRADAYALKVTRVGDRWMVAAAGRSAAGAKYATYRLMEEMQIDGRGARVGPLDVHASPFFPTRSVSLFNIWRVPVDVIRRCNLEAWPAEKVQRSIDAYDAYGFNAIETHDRFHEDFLKAVYGITRAQWRDKVYAMCDRAHENGMTVFLRLWGNSVALPVKEVNGNTPFGFVNLAPDIPEERKRWEREIRDYAAQNYAAHIDHLIGHWADAGGVHPGSKATVKDAMLLHNELVDAFRAINPKVQSTFNLWGMANPRGIRGWPGYEDHRSICDAGILPKDVAIAQTTRSRSHHYSERETNEIIASGHPAAVWTWRRADTEVRFGDTGLRIRLHGLMGDYFNNLPDSARQLQWHNIERNHHGISNEVNYYVAGKLMWDPKADVDVLLNKYCQLVFGAANAKAMAEAFNTVEAARHIEKFVSAEFIADPAAGARRANAALDGVAHVKLPDGHHSRLPEVITPQEMVEELRDTLTVIAENARIMSEELPAIDALLKAGNREQAAMRGAALRATAQRWVDSVQGGVEGYWLKETLKEKLGTTSTAPNASPTQPSETKDGLLTSNIASIKLQDASAGGGFIIASDGAEPGFALLQHTPPATGPVEFRFHIKSAQPDGTRNGGFVFGPTSESGDLIRCQVMLRGKILHIRGAGVTAARRDVPELDPASEYACVVRVDPAARRVTFTVGEWSVEAKLGPDVKPISYYGYIVERTATQFSPIEVTIKP